MPRSRILWVLSAACLMMAVIAPARAADVTIDIRPGSPHNAIKSAHAIVDIAVLGSATVDANLVDYNSLCFGSATRPKNRSCTPEPGYRIIDVNDDGHLDFYFKFSAADTGIRQDDTSACVNGLYDGTPFEACDSIRTRS